LGQLLGEKADAVGAAIKNSIGREPSGEEFKAIKELADSLLNLYKVRNELDAYLKESSKRIMPNIVYLIDYKVASELLAKAGSMQRLGMMPASTVQLLGAEKALFKHIKYGSRPPKHGFLYKLPDVTSAGKRERGRIARMYATKISIASKADAFSKRFIADTLKEDLEKSRMRRRSERKRR
jgi:nucleolar protein 56